jgi:hypothetical protein
VTFSLDRFPIYQKLNRLLHEGEFDLQPECGDAILYQGQLYAVLAVHKNQIALVDDLARIPFHEEDILEVNDWKQEPTCLFIPKIENVLHMIFQKSGHYPIMTPGIQSGRDVWQITHPHSDRIIASSLQEALFLLAIHILEKK